MIGVVSVILIIMWLLGIVFLQDFYEFTKELDVKDDQVEIVSLLSKGDIAESYELVFELSRENDLFVEVFDNEGRIIISPYMYFAQNNPNIRMNFGNMMSSIVATNAVKEMISKGENSKVIKIKPNKDDTRKNQENAIMLVNGFNTRSGKYYVATRTSLAPIQSTADILGRLFIIMMAVVLVVSLILAFAFSSTITKPIRNLSAGARQVAAGNYDINIPVTNAISPSGASALARIETSPKALLI